MIRWGLALMILATAASADEDEPGAFDYYVLSLSWTPTWCALEGDARRSTQCDPGQGYGFTLHGLWPQYETGWPSYCASTERAPSRRMTAEMVDIMGSTGLAWHQWNKHGVCSGLSAEDYFEVSRAAYAQVERPDLLRQHERPVRLPAQIIEEAFLEVNETLEPDMLTVTCSGGRVQEIRICLTRGLEPRNCGADVVRDCTLQEALFSPMR
jgi:ribonuclease T2